MNPLVESVISNVAIGAGNPQSGDRSTRPELGTGAGIFCGI